MGQWPISSLTTIMAMTRLFFDKKFMERKLEVIKTTYEHHKELAAEMAGPAVIEMFGEEPFSPEQTKEALSLTAKQEELSLQFDSRQSQIVNSYIPALRSLPIRCRRSERIIKKSLTR